MESVVQGAVAGLIAALAATTILGLANYVRQWLARRRDVQYIRDILIEGRKRVLDAEDTFHKGMDQWMTADTLRAAQYNNMITEVGIALERWAPNLSHVQRKDIYDALDWYHTDALHAMKGDRSVEFKEVPEGKWPTKQMPLEHATRIFEKLRSVHWLKMQD